MTSNPGSAGGVLVTRDGRLLAILGKELRNRHNNTWLNYAIPIAELRASVDAILAGGVAAAPAVPEMVRTRTRLPVAIMEITEWAKMLIKRSLSPASALSTVAYL